jgi:hypothetical protein
MRYGAPKQMPYTYIAILSTKEVATGILLNW